MKKLLALLACMTSLTTAEIAQAAPVITIYTTSAWSNMYIVNPNTPGTVCYQSGRLKPGASIEISDEDINKNLQKCYVNQQLGIIFFGNQSNAPFPPQYVKHGQTCTASWKLLGNRLVFECADMQ